MQISKSIERNYVKKKNQNDCQYVSSNCGIDYGKPSVCHLLCLTIGLYRSDSKLKKKLKTFSTIFKHPFKNDEFIQ